MLEPMNYVSYAVQVNGLDYLIPELKSRITTAIIYSPLLLSANCFSDFQVMRIRHLRFIFRRIKRYNSGMENGTCNPFYVSV